MVTIKTNQQSGDKSLDTIQRNAQLVLDKAQSLGADADLIVDQNQSLSLSANEGKLDKHEVSSTQIYGLRVIKDNRVGTAYSEADDETSLLSMVEQALVNAEYADTEEHESILANAQTLVTDNSILCPEDTLSIDEKIDFVLRLESELTAKSGIKNVPYNGLGSSKHSRQLFSTAGLNALSQKQSSYAYAHALAEDGEKNAMEGFGQSVRQSQQLNADEIIDETYRNCMSMLQGTPIPSGRYDVVFDKENQPNLFGVFSMVLSGKSAKDGINPWREKLGELVADERLSLYDNPTFIEGYGYDLFDAEGTATRKIDLISQGKLNTLLHNSVTANYFGVETTGHAVRGAKSTLGVADHQLMIAPGESNSATLKAGEYLEVTDLTGMHSGANAISGDFSFGASGYLCRDGERIQPVRGITVAGNFYKMLTNIALIGDTQYWDWSKSSYMPAIRFADLAISGE